MSTTKTLTPRQLEIITLIANGHRIVEIATICHLSPSSVEKTIHRARISAGARTLPHLVSITIASGLLEWSPEREERYLNGNVDSDDRGDGSVPPPPCLH